MVFLPNDLELRRQGDPSATIFISTSMTKKGINKFVNSKLSNRGVRNTSDEKFAIYSVETYKEIEEIIKNTDPFIIVFDTITFMKDAFCTDTSQTPKESDVRRRLESMLRAHSKWGRGDYENEGEFSHETNEVYPDDLTPDYPDFLSVNHIIGTNLPDK
jgi:hypothetical protein